MQTGLSFKLIILFVILFLIITSFLTYYMYFLRDAIVNEEIFEKEIDNRISPLTTQAVFFEINRIRIKGIIDHMYKAGFDIFETSPTRGSELQIILDGLRPGLGWRKAPSFRYDVSIQNTNNSRYCDFFGNAIYSTWDTDYINNEIFTSVEEEQKSSEILFTLKKLEGNKYSDNWIDLENFKVIYDFRKGIWDGDDRFHDNDGYGHFNGKNFELWFDIKQTDYDGDGIPWWIEVNELGSNPRFDDSKIDPDNDGIPTSWEWKWGYDPFISDNHSILDPDSDGLQNIEEYYMSKWLANPFHSDIYIEVDYMDKSPFKLLQFEIVEGKIFKNKIKISKSPLDGSDHIFWEESQQMLIERFSEHNITVHIDDGIMGGGGEILPFEFEKGMYNQEQGVVSEFYKNNFADERKGIFRYLFIAHGGGWCYPQDYHHYYDCMCVPSKQVFYKNNLDLAISPRAKRIGRAVQVMHELGHSCGFNKVQHTPGVDNLTTDWLDYQSVMNYWYFRQRYLDYSDGSHGEKDTNDWNLIDIAFFQRPSNRMEGVCPKD